MKEELNHILHKHTNQSLQQIQQDTDRDYFMTPEQAKDYGLVDEIITVRQ